MPALLTLDGAYTDRMASDLATQLNPPGALATAFPFSGMPMPGMAGGMSPGMALGGGAALGGAAGGAIGYTLCVAKCPGKQSGESGKLDAITNMLGGSADDDTESWDFVKEHGPEDKRRYIAYKACTTECKFQAMMTAGAGAAAGAGAGGMYNRYGRRSMFDEWTMGPVFGLWKYAGDLEAALLEELGRRRHQQLVARSKEKGPRKRRQPSAAAESCSDFLFVDAIASSAKLPSHPSAPELSPERARSPS